MVLNFKDQESLFMVWKIHVIKMSFLPKLIHKFNVIPSKIPQTFWYKLTNWF